MKWLSSIASGLIKPVTDLLMKKQERKQAKQSAAAKLLQTKQDGVQSLEMTDAEWEEVSTSLQGDTWKDEYVTVSVMSLVNLIIVGGVASAFGYPQVLEGTTIAIQALRDVGLDVGTMVLAVVFAAIGLKLWRA